MLGAINAVAEISPAISWARGADVMAFVYYEKSEHAIWKLKNPRALKKAPYRDPVVVAQGTVPVAAPSAPVEAGGAPVPAVRPDPAAHLKPGGVRDSSIASQSFYRPSGNVARASGELPVNVVARAAETVSIRAMMDSFDFNLPDSTRFKESNYKVRFTPEYVAQPSIGYQAGGMGQGAYGGTMIILSDLLGDHRLAVAAAINGQLSDAQVFVGYTSLGRRLQYATGVSQKPIYCLSGYAEVPVGGNQTVITQEIHPPRPARSVPVGLVSDQPLHALGAGPAVQQHRSAGVLHLATSTTTWGSGPAISAARRATSRRPTTGLRIWRG